MTELFVDYRIGNSEWILCPLSEVEKRKVETDFHVTWQRYCNEHQGQYGECCGNFVADFDCETDIEIAKHDCIKVYDFLVRIGVNPKNIRIFFSGRKGFHLEIDYRAFMVRPIFDLHLIYLEMYRHLERKIKPERHSSTMDKSLYASRKTLRYPNTIHPKSGLYCTPLSREQLNLPMARIFDLAGSPRPFDENYVDDPVMKGLFAECQTDYWKSVENLEKRQALVKEYTGGDPPCIKKIMSEGIPDGDRNNIIYLTTRFLKGIKSESEVYSTIEAIADRSYNGSKDLKGVQATVKSALRREGSFLACSSLDKWCDKEQCNVFSQKDSMAHVSRVEKAFDLCSYKDAVPLLKAAIKSGEYSRVLRTGIDQLDRKTKILQDSVIVIGALSDVGKTSFAVTIARNNQEKRVLYLGIEEGRDRTAMRLYRSKIAENKNITIATGRIGSITPADIYSLAYANSSKFDFMIIDQLINLSEASTEERLKYKRMMEQFRMIAREFKKPIFILHQLNRTAKFNKDSEPSKEQLAEGADIERQAYDIWLLYRRKVGEIYYNLLKIDKNKNYKSPIVLPLDYDFDTNTFKDYPSKDINWSIFQDELGINRTEYLRGEVEESIRIR